MSTSTVTPPSVSGIAADIAKELREHPERWMQHYLVRFRSGFVSNSVESISQPDAISWCLEGHILRRAMPLEYEAVGEFQEVSGFESLSSWNDEPGRTVQDIISLCESVAGVSENPDATRELSTMTLRSP